MGAAMSVRSSVEAGVTEGEDAAVTGGKHRNSPHQPGSGRPPACRGLSSVGCMIAFVPAAVILRGPDATTSPGGRWYWERAQNEMAHLSEAKCGRRHAADTPQRHATRRKRRDTPP